MREDVVGDHVVGGPRRVDDRPGDVEREELIQRRDALLSCGGRDVPGWLHAQGRYPTRKHMLEEIAVIARDLDHARAGTQGVGA